jgi:hypothetical protein
VDSRDLEVHIHDQRHGHRRIQQGKLLGTAENEKFTMAKFSKSNSPFVMPSLDRGPLVVVPPGQLKKIYSLPETLLDAHGPQNETLQVRYTIHDPEVWVNNFHINVIRNQLTRNLGLLTPAIADELARGFEKHWGISEEWMPVNVWTSCMGIVAGASNRVFIGPPYCSC